MVKKFISKVISKKDIAEDTTQADLSIPQEGFDFTAGQYVSISIPSLSHLPIPDQFKDFSIASAPHEKAVSIAYRDNDKSPFKSSLKEGAEVEISGPKGVFTLPEEQGQEIAFIAGGIGITPFLSMIKDAVFNNKNYKITLFYCNSSKERAAYIEELKKISEENKNMSLVSIIGALNEDVINNYLSTNAKPSGWYIAGPPGMVASARETLRQNNINDDTIKTEEFSGY